MTDAERLLWRHLRLRQASTHKFRRQYAIGTYIADFVCIKAGLVVEVDGGQHASSVQHDELRTQTLEKRGYRVLRFWNNDVLTNIEGVLLVIELELKLKPPPSQPSP
jgi:adenine-specific DNA-methyltransferase